jgi:hypothetical protein
VRSVPCGEAVLFPEKTGPRGAQKASSGGAPARVIHKVVPEKRLVRVKFGKRLGGREIGSYAAWLRGNALFDPSFAEIVDLRDVEQMDLGGAEMMKLADEIDPFSPESKRAFVVRNSTQSHAARMHQILRTSKENLRIFNSISEAEAWIESFRETQTRD